MRIARPIWPLLIAAWWSLPATGFAAGSAAPSAAEVQAWLTAEAAGRAEDVLAHRTLRLRLTNEFHYPMEPAALEALRRRVGHDPTHPDYMRLSFAEQYAERGPNTEHRTAWSRSPEEWRVQCDFARDGHGYDVAFRPTCAWMWNGPNRTELCLFDPREGFPPERNVPVERSLVSHPLGLLLFARIGQLREPSLDLRASAIENADDLRLRIVSKQSALVGTVRARWDAASGRGFVSEIRLDPMDGASTELPTIFRAEGWRFEPALAHWIAAGIETYSADGSLTIRARFESAEPVSDEEFDSVTRAPDPSRADPVRPWRIDRISDYRVDARAAVPRSPLAPVPAVGFIDSLRSAHALRIAGWAAGGVLILALLLMRVSRSRAARAHRPG